jgi:hypothetical protein
MQQYTVHSSRTLVVLGSNIKNVRLWTLSVEGEGGLTRLASEIQLLKLMGAILNHTNGGR